MWSLRIWRDFKMDRLNVDLLLRVVQRVSLCEETICKGLSPLLWRPIAIGKQNKRHSYFEKALNTSFNFLRKHFPMRRTRAYWTEGAVPISCNSLYCIFFVYQKLLISIIPITAINGNTKCIYCNHSSWFSRASTLTFRLHHLRKITDHRIFLCYHKVWPRHSISNWCQFVWVRSW